MKISLSILFLFLCTTTFAQQVILEGTVKDTISRIGKYSRPRPSIIVNDTVNKLADRNSDINRKALEYYTLRKKMPSLKPMEDKWQDIALLYKDTNYVVRPTADGTFRMKVDLKDTLYFTSRHFITQIHTVKDLLKLKKIDIRLAPQICEEYIPCTEKPSKFYAFIGEKISVTRRDPYYCNEENVFRFDTEFAAKYKLIKNMYGTLTQDTINFTAFDHYGTPDFSKYQYVMLFIADHCGKLINAKYQYFDVYPTIDGRWASPGDPYRYDQWGWLPKEIKAEPIAFKDSLSLYIPNEPPEVIKEKYPAPYFKLENDRIYPLAGTYADSLFEIKKKGVLKAVWPDMK